MAEEQRTPDPSQPFGFVFSGVIIAVVGSVATTVDAPDVVGIAGLAAVGIGGLVALIGAVAWGVLMALRIHSAEPDLVRNKSAE